jgi:hypothetical protein
VDGGGPARRNSELRYRALERRLRGLERPLTVEALETVLADHDEAEAAICRHRREDAEDMTNASVVMEFGHEPALHVAGGPPCRTAFHRFSFVDYLSSAREASRPRGAGSNGR